MEGDLALVFLVVIIIMLARKRSTAALQLRGSWLS